jgi:hypothetical protein
MFPLFSVLGRSADDIVAAETRLRKSKMLHVLNIWMATKAQLAAVVEGPRSMGIIVRVKIR